MYRISEKKFVICEEVLFLSSPGGWELELKQELELELGTRRTT